MAQLFHRFLVWFWPAVIAFGLGLPQAFPESRPWLIIQLYQLYERIFVEREFVAIGVFLLIALIWIGAIVWSSRLASEAVEKSKMEEDPNFPKGSVAIYNGPGAYGTQVKRVTSRNYDTAVVNY